jgi:hypothetical protein
MGSGSHEPDVASFTVQDQPGVTMDIETGVRSRCACIVGDSARPAPGLLETVVTARRLGQVDQ